MATTTNGASATTTNNTNTYSVAVTPAVGDLLVLFVSAMGTDAAGTCTSNQGITFTKITSALRNTSADTIYMFVADQFATSAVSHTLTFDCTGNNATGAILSVLRVAGMFRTGSNAVRQFKAVANQAGATAPAATFDSTPLTENVCLAVAGQSSTNTLSFTAPTSWTKAVELTAATPSQNAGSYFRDSGQTAATVTWNSTNSLWAVIIAEMDTRSRTATLTATQDANTLQALGRVNTSTIAVRQVLQTSGTDDPDPKIVPNALAGSVFVVSPRISGTGRSIVGVSDTMGNTWTKIGTALTSSNGNVSELWYMVMPSDRLTEFTINIDYSTNVDFNRAVYLEIINCASSPLDQYGQIVDSTSPFEVSTSGATTQADEMVVLFSLPSSAVSPQTVSGYTTQSDDTIFFGYGVFTKVVSATGTQSASATMGTTTDVMMHIVTFKQVGGANRTATLSQTQAGDTLAATAVKGRDATLTATQAADTLAATAKIAISSSLTKTQDDNTLAATAKVALNATLSATQADNTLSSSADVLIAATLNATQDANTGTASADLPISATVAATQADNTLASSATLPISASLSATQDAQTLAASATISQPAAPVTATLSATQDGQTLASTAKLAIAASLSVAQDAQTSASSADVEIRATVTATQDSNSLVSAAALAIRATVTAAQNDNTLAADATISQPAGPISATLTATQDDQTLVSVATLATPDQGGGGGGGGYVQTRREEFLRRKLRRELEEAIRASLEPPEADSAAPAATTAPEPAPRVTQEQIRAAIRALPVFQLPSVELVEVDVEAIARGISQLLLERHLLALKAANEDDEEAMFLIKLAML